MIKLLKDDDFFDNEVIDIIKFKYNENLKRIKKAENYFKSSSDINSKHLNMFMDLFEENIKLLNEYKEVSGLNVSLEVLEGGF